MTAGTVPAWLLVMAVGAVCQLVKLLLYGLAQRRLQLRALVTANGLPSLYGAAFGCLTTLVALSHGVASPAFTLVALFSGIVLHDAMRVQLTAGAGGRRARDLAGSFEEMGGHEAGWLERLRPSLAERGHRPAHVAVGAMLGLLAALGFGGTGR
jgi:acid phosphatase family membrane protein YuiD